MRPTERNKMSCRQPRGIPDPRVCAARLAVCLTVLLAAKPAAAQELRPHAEGAAAVWLDDPQASRFTPGLYLAVRPGLSPGRVVDLQWSYAMIWTPAAEGFTEDGTAHSVTADIRLRPLATLRPATKQLGGLFVDFNLGYVRSEDLDRFGFDAGLGYGFQPTSWFSLGPVVRYTQIVQPDDIADHDRSDAHLLTVGLDFGFGPAHEEAAEHKCPAAPEADDRCPLEIGPPATLGCPIDPCGGKPRVVLVQFEYNSATLPPPKEDPQTMDPVLDAVANAMAKDAQCRVCIIGHASEEGTAGHNKDLSRRRAPAVQGYLGARRMSEVRMPFTGLGGALPAPPGDHPPAEPPRRVPPPAGGRVLPGGLRRVAW